MALRTVALTRRTVGEVLRRVEHHLELVSHLRAAIIIITRTGHVLTFVGVQH